MPQSEESHFDEEFDRMRRRILETRPQDALGSPPDVLQYDMLDLLLRSLRSECLSRPPDQRRLKLRPVTWAEAKAFVARHHAHHPPPQGWKFGCGAEDDLGLVGVVIVGRPVSRRLDDGQTLEVTRLCTLRHAHNAASLLLGAACRAAKALGYRRVVTYTRSGELAACCKAAGFIAKSAVRGQDWSRPSRRRRRTSEVCDRVRWERRL